MYRHIDQSRGAHAKAAEVVGAQGGLTQSGGVAEGAEGVVWRAQGGAALAHGLEAFQPPPRAADGNFYGGWVK